MTMQDSDIRNLLDAVDVPAPKVDLGEAVRLGQRVRHRRRIAELTGATALCLVVVAAVGLTLAVRPFSSASTGAVDAASSSPRTPSPRTPRSTPPAPAPAVTACQVSVLPLPPGVSNYQVEATDPSGRYAVGWASSDTIYATMFWDNGRPQAMHVTGRPGVDAVNAQGVAVGSTFTRGFGQEKVFRWANGSTTLLAYPMAGSWHPYGIAINDAGDITASVEPQGESGGVGGKVVLWRAGTTTGVALPIDYAIAITDSGLIVGNQNLSDNSHANDRAAVYDLHGRLLHSLPSKYIDAVSPTGDLAVGRGGDLNNPQPFLWNLRTNAVTPLDQRITLPWAVNAHGWVLDLNSGLYKGTAVQSLPPLKPADMTGTGKAALADNGVVVGQSVADDGRGRSTPVRWRC
jgi:hypothetical protein